MNEPPLRSYMTLNVSSYPEYITKRQQELAVEKDPERIRHLKSTIRLLKRAIKRGPIKYLSPIPWINWYKETKKVSGTEALQELRRREALQKKANDIL